MKTKTYFDSIVELYKQWMENKADLEVYNPYSKTWEPLGQFTGDFTSILRDVRKVKEIELPEEIYVNIYSNGKMFAHPTLKDAINSIDSGWGNTQFVTKVYVLGEPS